MLSSSSSSLVNFTRQSASISRRRLLLAAADQPFHFVKDDDKEDRDRRRTRQQYSQIYRREFHSTVKNQSIVMVCLGIAGAAFGGSILLDSLAKSRAESAAAAAAEGKTDAKDGSASSAGGGFPSFFSGFLGAKTFYQGGFEPTMTKREAALILGVRESASREKIREAHRNMSRANHPDTGGSEYLAMKINQAKDMLLGSK